MVSGDTGISGSSGKSTTSRALICSGLWFCVSLACTSAQPLIAASLEVFGRASAASARAWAMVGAYFSRCGLNPARGVSRPFWLGPRPPQILAMKIKFPGHRRGWAAQLQQSRHTTSPRSTARRSTSRSDKLNSRDGWASDEGGIPPALRNHHFVVVNDLPTASPACRHGTPERTNRQN